MTEPYTPLPHLSPGQTCGIVYPVCGACRGTGVVPCETHGLPCFNQCDECEGSGWPA